MPEGMAFTNKLAFIDFLEPRPRSMKQGELLPHLFRTEYTRIVSVLCRQFGFDRIDTAVDIASETFLAAAPGVSAPCGSVSRHRTSHSFNAALHGTMPDVSYG